MHIDIIVMPLSDCYRYCLTCIHRYTQWPEAYPMKDMEVITVAKALYEGWICRFGAPLIIATDQGRQFESHLYNALCKLMGTKHIHTTSYHSGANSMVECFHRPLKAAIRFTNTTNELHYCQHCYEGSEQHEERI